MMTSRMVRTAIACSALGILAACADQPEILSPSLEVTATAVPAEGALTICKAGNAAGTFGFAWTITYAIGGAPYNSGTQSVAVGACVQVAQVPGTPRANLRVSVTEDPLPADWTLASISATVGHPTPPATVVSLGTRTISNVGLSHDVGATITFDNLYTPPPPPPAYCTLTQGYWKNHTGEWDQAGEKYVRSGQTFYNSGLSYIQIMNTPPAGGNAYIQLAHQFIAASLNVNGVSGSGVAAVDAALAGAHAALGGWAAGIGAPAKNSATRTQWQAWATTLDDFNNGLTGPGHCN